MRTIFDNLLLTIGIINIILLIVSIIVIVNNKKMTTIGRVLRIVEIIILPVLGPILILIEVLLWRMEDEKTKKKTD